MRQREAEGRPRLNSANSFPLSGVTVSTASWLDGAAISMSAMAVLVRDSALPPSRSPLARSTSVTRRVCASASRGLSDMDRMPSIAPLLSSGPPAALAAMAERGPGVPFRPGEPGRVERAGVYGPVDGGARDREPVPLQGYPAGNLLGRLALIDDCPHHERGQLGAVHLPRPDAGEPPPAVFSPGRRGPAAGAWVRPGGERVSLDLPRHGRLAAPDPPGDLADGFTVGRDTMMSSRSSRLRCLYWPMAAFAMWFCRRHHCIGASWAFPVQGRCASNENSRDITVRTAGNKKDEHMASVTQIVNGVTGGPSAVKQPRGGYLNPRSFNVRKLDGPGLHDEPETVGPGIIGMVVDYMTRVQSGVSVGDAFSVSLAGARKIDRLAIATKLSSQIEGLDDDSIAAACRLVNYDAVFRAGIGLPGHPSLPEPGSIVPDGNTCDNIRIMVQRSLRFFEEYGPVVADGMTFAGGYTDRVDSGDADFMTYDTVWDFKVKKTKINAKHTLQLCIYWLLGLHSTDSERYKKVNRLGFFNPRKNEVMTIDIAEIARETIHEIEVDVIGYNRDEAIY